MRSLSLKYSIALVVFLLEVVMVSLILWRTESVSLRKLEANQLRANQAIFHMLAQPSRLALINEAFSDLRPYFSKVQHGPRVLEVILADHRDIVVATTVSALLGRKLPPFENNGFSYWHTEKISNAAGPLGLLAVRFSSGELQDALRAARRQGLVVAVAGMFGIAVAGVAMGFLLTRRLERLAAAARRISAGEHEIRLDEAGGDEVASLGKAFNALTDHLQRRLGDLHESEERFRHYFERSTIGFALTSVGKGWIRVNQHLCSMLGYTEEELLQKTWAEMTYPEDLEPEVERFNKLLAGEIDNYKMDKRFYRKGGEMIYTRLTASCVRNPDGTVEHMIATLEDITEGKLAGAALRESEEKYRILAAESPVSIMAFDGEGRVTFVNNWHLKTFAKSKYGPGFFVGKKITELPGLVRAGIAPELERVLKGETVFLEDVYFPEFTGGHSGYQSIKGMPVFKGDEFVGGILLREDVSQRKRAEEELKKHRDHLEELVLERTKEVEDAQKALVNLLEDVNLSKKDLESANKKLEELDRLKSMFIASMSHELRTPLNSIIGFTGIILQGMTGEITAEQRDQLQRVYGSAKHLLSLISDVIDISKVEAGKFEVHVEKFSLDGVIREAVSNFTPEITRKGLDLEISLPQDMQMTSDRKRLLQCVLNFLSNAVKFTEKGGIRIAVQEVDEMIKISVEDTGIGIKEEDVPRLFGSFVRLDSPIRTITLGTGLGLYLTKKLVTEALHGEVFVDSRYGEGSRFGMRIPKGNAQNSTSRSPL